MNTGNEKEDPRARTGSLLGKVLDDFILGLENSWPLIKPGGSETVAEHSIQSLAGTETQLQRELGNVNTSGKARGWGEWGHGRQENDTQ